MSLAEIILIFSFLMVKKINKTLFFLVWPKRIKRFSFWEWRISFWIFLLGSKNTSSASELPTECFCQFLLMLP